jgi:hypothetical protein
MATAAAAVQPTRASASALTFRIFETLLSSFSPNASIVQADACLMGNDSVNDS